MSTAATWCRMLLIASMQWILTNELLRRCKKLANLNSLYSTGPNQRVSNATTTIFYKNGGFEIQTAWLWGRLQQRTWDINRALSQNDPKYLCIAMLPCTMLWPWIAGQLIASVEKNNPYYVWFDENKPSDQSHLERFVDHFFVQVEPEEQQKCLSIFQGLVNELNFFRSACDQTLFYYSSFLE